MKIKGISKSLSTDEKIVLVTEPPLTKEVFEKFKSMIPKGFAEDFAFMKEEGCLVIIPNYISFSKSEAEYIEKMIESAHAVVERAWRLTEMNRLALLTEIAQSSGWPIEEEEDTAQKVTAQSPKPGLRFGEPCVAASMPL